MKSTLLLLFSLIYLTLAAQQKSITIDSKIQKRTIDTMSKRLVKIYLDEKVGRAMADKIQQQYKLGAYRNLMLAEAFAAKVTEDLFSISHDRHIGIKYGPGNITDPTSTDNPNDLKSYETMLPFAKTINFGFDKVEILDGNVAYINFAISFHPYYANPVLEAAMQFVANSNALIIDFRRNGGGHPGPGNLLLSYLFKDSVLLSRTWWRYNNKTIENYTEPSMAKYFYNKPVYILLQHKNLSAPEAIGYILQSLNRGKVVGEATAGAANPGMDIRLNEYFTIFIPNGHVEVASTGTNWEGKGIIPDVPASKANALKVAHQLAIKEMIEKEKDVQRKKELEEILKNIH